jgi:hypothetical protein
MYLRTRVYYLTWVLLSEKHAYNCSHVLVFVPIGTSFGALEVYRYQSSTLIELSSNLTMPSCHVM